MRTGNVAAIKREEYNQGQGFFEFFNGSAFEYVRPLVMAFDLWRAHTEGHSGAAGLAKWLEWHYPLSANQ